MSPLRSSWTSTKSLTHRSERGWRRNPAGLLTKEVVASGIAHMGSFGSRGEIHSCIGQTPKAVAVSEVRARLHDAARFRARSTSHPVAVRDGCTNIPLAAGRGSGGRNHSHFRHTGHGD